MTSFTPLPRATIARRVSVACVDCVRNVARYVDPVGLSWGYDRKMGALFKGRLHMTVLRFDDFVYPVSRLAQGYHCASRVSRMCRLSLKRGIDMWTL